ncbi:hypothetical protein PoB_000960300 [Plakobranchus ocellatus]|uniref:Uncharacterized protein n=1 Tax=Plakobranchus ocellatus TaxID=259542 RepID=A0AAV3YL82_9GAST|nr:hypothetical protein PoB_000960300 [Plakobranchus ocellatus]
MARVNSEKTRIGNDENNGEGDHNDELNDKVREGYLMRVIKINKKKYANIALDETSFGLAEPETVTDLVGFHEELIKYRTELDKLYESLNASYGDLTNGEVSQTFADAVWTLQDKIGYVYGDVNNLIISLQLLRGLTPQPIDLTTAAGQTHEDFSTATTTAAATASTTAELKHLSIIRSEAKYVSGNLKELLTLWRHRCDACGYF